MTKCLISLGANLGDPRASIALAAERLQVEFACPAERFQVSGFYRTPPVGGPTGQPPFVNAVVALHTELDPWQAWGIVRKVESELGRVRLARWEARKIDIDILLFGANRIWTPQLKIPHPRMCMRRFILIPAAEVAADWLDPVSGWTLKQLASSVQNAAGNLVLVAAPQSKAAGLLEEAARLARATWLTRYAPPPADRPQARWVSLMETRLADPTGPPVSTNLPWLDLQNTLNTKLVVYLAQSTQVEGAAWEDVHARLAAELNLCQREKIVPLGLVGPRYLLASDDRKWALHELVSALDAMDCPIERI